MKKEYIAKVLDLTYKGIIIEIFGAGNATTADWFLRAIQTAIHNGKLILNVSQCFRGALAKACTKRALS